MSIARAKLYSTTMVILVLWGCGGGPDAGVRPHDTAVDADLIGDSAPDDIARNDAVPDPVELDEVVPTDAVPDEVVPDDASGPACSGGECVADPSDLRIDVRTVAVSGTIAVEGPLTCASLWFVSLDRSDETHEIALPCGGASRPFAGRLPAPGAYAVKLWLPARATSTGMMLGTLTLEPRFEVVADRTDVSFEVALVSLSGRITQNGVTPVELPGCTGAPPIAVTFRETGASAAVTTYLPCGAGFDFNGVLLHRDRSYAVRVGSRDGTTSLPDDVSVARAAYHPSTDDAVFDVRTSVVSGAITRDGATPEAVGCGLRAAQVQFRDAEQGTTHYAQIPCDTDWTFAVTLPHGTYEVGVGGEGSNLPGWAHLIDALTVPGDRVGTLDVETVAVPLTLTLNGAPWPTADCSDTLATLVFVSDRPGGFGLYEPVPCASGGAVALALPAGTYRVLLGGRFPFADGSRTVELARDVVLPSDGALALDLRTATVGGTVTRDGVPLEDLCSSQPGGAAVIFQPTGDVITKPWFALVACDGGGAFALELPLGSYAVQLDSEGGSVLPPSVQLAERLEVTADRLDLAFDAKVVRVSGAITVDGERPTGDTCPLHAARATLRRDADADAEGMTGWAELIIPCGSPDWRFEDVAVPAGAHLVTTDGARVPHTSLPYRLRIE